LPWDKYCELLYQYCIQSCDILNPYAAFRRQLDITIPYKWEEQFANIERVFERKEGPPVQMLEIKNVTDNDVEDKVFRLQVLVALMLSYQNLPDAVTSAMQKLREFGCNVEQLRAATSDRISKCLFPLRYYRQRAEDIKKTVEILHEKYNDDIPETLQDLWSLPGVKPITALLASQYAWKRIEGIAVHLRLHLISNRLGWTCTSTYEDTKDALEKFVPRGKWGVISEATYWFGTRICSFRPKCMSCVNKEICPRLHARYLDD
uniref:ENDO3c domain-containing protein n=1 Tax=Enterobius vermicularis TaxID=51028 RepID=A0A0N4UTR1_ENTVE